MNEKMSDARGRNGTKPLTVCRRFGMLTRPRVESLPESFSTFTFRAVPVVLAGCFFLACGGHFDPSVYPTTDALLEASVAAFDRGDCGDAEIGLQRLVYDLPNRDPNGARVRYYLGECHFRGKRFLEAAREFRRVADEYGQDSLAPEALLRAGEANTRLWRRSELDPTYGLSALGVYSEVLSRFPTGYPAERARERIVELNGRFAKKAFDTGVTYMRRKAYDSAIIYFRGVVADFPQSSFAPEALIRLVEAYGKIGYQENRRDMCLQLERYYADALARAPTCVSDTMPN